MSAFPPDDEEGIGSWAPAVQHSLGKALSAPARDVITEDLDATGRETLARLAERALKRVDLGMYALDAYMREALREAQPRFPSWVPRAALVLQVTLSRQAEKNPKLAPQAERRRRLMADERMRGAWSTLRRLADKDKGDTKVAPWAEFVAALGLNPDSQPPLWEEFLRACCADIGDLREARMSPSDAAAWRREVRSSAAHLAGLLRGSLLDEEKDGRVSGLLSALVTKLDKPFESLLPGGARGYPERLFFVRALHQWAKARLGSPQRSLVLAATETVFGCTLTKPEIIRWTRGCVFRTKSATDSVAKLPPFPRQACR